MPELPEVETVRRGLAPVLLNARIKKVSLNRADLRFPLPSDMAERLENAVVSHVGRRAKYLLFTTDRGDVLLSHLGMSGSYRIETDTARDIGVFYHARGKQQAHDHVAFDLIGPDGQRSQVIYNDPRRFGFMDLIRSDALEENRFLAPLGIEPTGNALNGPALAARLAGKRSPLKAALLDQSLIAGLGNIYVCEALWRAQLSPRRLAHTLVRRDGRPTPRCEMLASAIRDVIGEAISAGGSSLRDYMQADGSLGYFQHSFSAYDQAGEACGHADCGGTIKRIVQSGRSTFFCPTCQR